MTIKTFLRGQPDLTYFTIVFKISWGSFFVFIGPAAFVGSRAISFADIGPIALLAFLAGPSVAGILTMGLVHGKTGLREIWARLR